MTTHNKHVIMLFSASLLLVGKHTQAMNNNTGKVAATDEIQAPHTGNNSSKKSLMLVSKIENKMSIIMAQTFGIATPAHLNIAAQNGLTNIDVDNKEEEEENQLIDLNAIELHEVQQPKSVPIEEVD